MTAFRKGALMKRIIISEPICCVLCVWASAWAMAAESPDKLAQAILSKAGIHATLCELPRVGDGVLAAALARVPTTRGA